MCLVETLTYIYADGRRLQQPYHNLCNDSLGGRPCKSARYHDLGERYLAGAQPTHGASSLDGYVTTHHRPSPPASDTMSQSKHSRKGSSQDSTGSLKWAFTRPARRLSMFSRKDSVTDSKKTTDRPHRNVVVDQLTPPSTPRESILEAPPLIRTVWSDPAMTRDKRSPTSVRFSNDPSIRPVSYPGEPRYEIRTPTGSTPPESKSSRRESRNYSSNKVIQDPPVREPVVRDPPIGPRANAVPPPPPDLPTPPHYEAMSYGLVEVDDGEPTTFSTEPEVSRYQNRDAQRRLASQRAHQISLEREIETLRARSDEQDAADQASNVERQRLEEQRRADRRRERSFREREEAAIAAADAAREADKKYRDTAQRIAQLQAEVDELYLRRHVVHERYSDNIEADTRARDERHTPRTEGHRTRDGRVLWTETERSAAESSRPARRSEGRAAQRNREVRETLDNLTLGSEEAVESDDGTVQGSHEHGTRRRRRRRRHHRGHRDHEDAA